MMSGHVQFIPKISVYLKVSTCEGERDFRFRRCPTLENRDKLLVTCPD